MRWRFNLIGGLDGVVFVVREGEKRDIKKRTNTKTIENERIK
jgi:hypothetical protein